MRQKISRLRLVVVVVVRQIQHTTTSNKLPSVEEENRLRKMVEAGCNAYEVAVELKRQPNAVYEKAKRLGLKVIISRKTRKIITTNSLQLPEDLPSVEEQLKRLELEVVVRQIQQTTTSNESFFNGCYEHPKAPVERTQRTFRPSF